MSDRTTKERILDAAEGLMLEKGFHSVGLNEILNAVKVPKGSFYYYFQSKEQFGVELLRHYVTDSNSQKRSVLSAEKLEPDPLQRLMTYLESNIAKFQQNEGKCPCLVVKLASEVAGMSEPMREVLADECRQWAAMLEELVREGIAKGVMRADLDATAAATMIQDLWAGAMQRASVLREVRPLRQALGFIRSGLVASPEK